MATRLKTVPLARQPAQPSGISPTSASTFRQCELKFVLSYGYGWQEAGTLPQLIGNATHKAVEMLYARAWDDRGRSTASDLLRGAYDIEVAAAQFDQLRDIAGLRDAVLVAGETSSPAGPRTSAGLGVMRRESHHRARRRRGDSRPSPRRRGHVKSRPLPKVFLVRCLTARATPRWRPRAAPARVRVARNVGGPPRIFRHTTPVFAHWRRARSPASSRSRARAKMGT